jgi:hypothetical protein
MSEPTVLSDSQFEAMTGYPWCQLDATGKLLTRIETGETFMRQGDWEKTLPPFGLEALVARERIEAARRAKHRIGPENEMLLLENEFYLLRGVTSVELEGYVAAEETITACQLKQRGILKAAGLRGNVWEDEEAAEALLHGHLDNSSYEFHRNWPGWDSLKDALEDFELSWLDALYQKIQVAASRQNEISRMVSIRHIDSHPEEYPNG